MPKAINSAIPSAALPDEVEAGKPFTIQLAPLGNYPNVVDDEEHPGEKRDVMQIVDEKAVQSMVDNFTDKVLVDADHSSETSTNTAAMAWVTRLFIDPEKGLMAEIEPTSEGADKINGRVYRFVSGAWTLDDAGRPVKLISIGLTNRPNLPVAPMLNAQTAEAGVDAGAGAGNGGTRNAQDAAAGSADTDGGEKGGEKANTADDDDEPGDGDDLGGEDEDSAETKAKEKLKMDIKEKLGLNPEATDDEVEVALDALIERAGTVDAVNEAMGLVADDGKAAISNEQTLEAVNAVVAKCAELQEAQNAAEQEKLNSEAEAFVAENEDVIPEEAVEDIKEEYIEDKEKAEATVANFRRVHERAVLNAQAQTHTIVKTKHVVINRSAGKRPAIAANAAPWGDCGGDPEAENKAIAAMYNNK
jgi:phage I-like protein